MKAWRIDTHGGSEVLKQQEIPTPSLLSGHAQVRVKAVGLNHLDVWVRKGVPGHKFPLPITPGCDVAGVVESVGDSKDSKWVGSPVLINPILSCGKCEACLEDFPPICKDFGLIGETCDGGCAEFITVPIQNLVSIPPSLPFEEAASLPIAYVTAWSMLNRKAQLKPKDLILIQAGGSGVSIAALQIAKNLGAIVITTVSDEAKAKKAKALGADFVIDYKKNAFRDEVKKICKAIGKRGVDVVIDHVGEDTFSESLKCLDWGGKIITCGATSGSQIVIDLKPIFFKNLSLMGSTMGGRKDLISILDWVKQGKLRPVIDSVLSMDQLPKALDKLESRQAFGKVILKW